MKCYKGVVMLMMNYDNEHDKHTTVIVVKDGYIATSNIYFSSIDYDTPIVKTRSWDGNNWTTHFLGTGNDYKTYNYSCIWTHSVNKMILKIKY